MKLFDRYMISQMLMTLAIVSVTLTLLILLTQSLKFLEVIISSGASAGSFLTLMGLALPKFAEAVFPISMMIATLFVYHKMTSDSELVILRASGSSPLSLARPALILSFTLGVVLLFFSTWLTPKSIAHLQTQRQEIQTEYASLLFREGVFNTVGNGLTAYIRKRSWNGELEGIMIHDTRPRKQGKNPYTLIAKSGVAMKSEAGQKIVVYDGVRQELNPDTRVVSRLDFSQYVIDIPIAAGALNTRWKEPEERTIFELLDQEQYSQADRRYVDDFKVEVHRRFSMPLLMMAFTITGLCALLLGPINRRGMSMRIVMAVAVVLVLQSLYFVMLNLAKDAPMAVLGLYAVGFVPMLLGLFVLSPRGDSWRRSLFFLRGATS